jgi:hypothetical protein
MTDTMTFQNIDLSSWDTLYINTLKPEEEKVEGGVMTDMKFYRKRIDIRLRRFPCSDRKLERR